uniref:RING finger protein 17 n=1 Tax=Pseudonaja textilis TaxID=8673 RepID=A0A670Y7R3_PSETE
MIATYFETENEAIKWEADMDCAAYVCEQNQWQRGKIIRIVSEKVVEVFLIDLGIVKTMDISCLRELEQNLKTIRPLAVECSLTNISPSGGTEQWTATACDTLKSYLTGAIVNLIIQDTNLSPLPVKIFCKDEQHCTDVSEYMIQKGLALRKRNVDIKKLVSEKEKEKLVSEKEDPSKLEKHFDPSDTDSKQQKLKISVAKPLVVEAYKPPVFPSLDCFSATVSCVSDNGTIYVIPTSQELMGNIQDNVKGLGLLKPYNWKSGEACVVRAADTMWYRGEVKEVGAGIVKVHYVDYGYTEKIPPCHLYPTVLYAEIAPFSIPCHLYKTVPVGNIWQHDAVELLKELLTKRSVKIRIMSKWPFSFENSGLLKNELKTPLLPPYTSPLLPILGEHFPVKVTHVVSPNEVYISIVHSNSTSQQRSTEDSLDSDTLEKALAQYNQNIETLPHLTDFQKDMPCLAEYSDGLWYRAKLISILEFNPVSVLVEFVDYGSTKTLLRQIPAKFMQYPAQAFRVLLAGFKPALHNSATERIPYCPEWSLDALWAAMNCFEGKNLSASSTHSPEHIIFLYEDGHLFHMKLVEMGFAELTQ